MTIMKPSNASLPSSSAWINLSDFETLCFNLARGLWNFKQPIPDFVTRNPGVLESCLQTPLQKFDDKDLYPTFEKKLAALFYFLIKNHPFQNGNKRIAVATLLVTLFLNSKWIRVQPVVLYKLAIHVSRSPMIEKDKELSLLEKFISDNMEQLNRF